MISAALNTGNECVVPFLHLKKRTIYPQLKEAPAVSRMNMLYNTPKLFLLYMKQ